MVLNSNFLLDHDIGQFLFLLMFFGVCLISGIYVRAPSIRRRVASTATYLGNLAIVRFPQRTWSKVEGVLSTNNWLGYLARVLFIGLSLLFFMSISFATLPRVLVNLFEPIPSIMIVLLALGTVLCFTYSVSGWLGDIVALISTLMMFATRLASVWNSGYSDGSLIGGLLPWSDASGYYWGAQRLLAGFAFDAWNGRRPWFSGLLGVILSVTQHNLQWTLAILALVSAFACFLLARELQRTSGILAAVTSQVIIFAFYTRFIGQTMTENLGLTLGLLAFAVLWRGSKKHQIGLVAFGIVLMGLGLTARAGAFIVLPILIIWAMWQFRSSVKGLLRLWPIAAVILVFVLDFVLRLILVGSNTTGFSNFSYSLYGIATGNRGWTQIYIDHPEVKLMSEQAASEAIYHLAFEEIRRDPALALKGVLSTWPDFFGTQYGLFSFMDYSAKSFLLVLYMLTIIGIIACLASYRSPEYSMLLSVLIGILLSIPFVPPIDSDVMRAYATTIPILAVFMGMGFSESTNYLIYGKRLPQQTSQKRFPVNTGLPVMAAFFVAICFLGPIALRVLVQPTSVSSQIASCDASDEVRYVHLIAQASLNLVDDSTEQQTAAPLIHLSDFRTRVAALTLYPALVQLLDSLGAGTSLTQATDLKDGSQYWLVSDTKLLPASSQNVKICTHQFRGQFAADYRFYHVDALWELP